MKILTLSLLLVSLYHKEVNALNLPGPRVYVVTPRTLQNVQIDEARSAPRPFYYHNWRRMDTPQNLTTTTTTTTTTVKTPDLIFAEFESDHMKSIRKLLEKERIELKMSTTTTPKPIYVPDEEITEPQNNNYGLPSQVTEMKEETKPSATDMTDYFALYNNMYNTDNAPPVPIYLPSTTTTPKTTTSTTTTTPAPINNVENIWHIIDNEKHNQYSGQWDEVPVNEGNKQETPDEIKANSDEINLDENRHQDDDDDSKIDENFALPGFGTNPGNGAENESRAIRTEQNIRFPYINLKPFQIKSNKKPSQNSFSSSKKGNNMYTSLDNFFDVKNPVRGEAQDVVPKVRQPIDRYNPAQPYLPQPEYGSKSKQSSPSSGPSKAVANLVPPPPPPAPQITADDFPAPKNYESFPPYAPSAPAPSPSVPKPPMSTFQMSEDSDDDSGPPSSDDSDAGPPMDLGYRYKPPSPPAQPFVPTLPPLKKPFSGYSYDKPMLAPPMDTDEKPDFQGYNYDKPMPDKELYHYNKPAPPMDMDEKPDFQGYNYDKPMPDKEVYHYSKPEPPSPPVDHPPPSYGHHGPPSYNHDSDYPELVFNKPHGGDMKGSDDTKGDDMGMVPPPMKPGLDASGPPMDDHGFPQDFPGDFKFHHDFEDDHDHYHHYHTHPTTTTTTEMPRVNRYSYYYLGKKLYYLPLYFSVYFIVYVGALIIKAVLRHKIVYPNSWRPNDQTAGFFSKRSVDSWDLSNDNLHEITGRVTHAIATAADKYLKSKET